MRASKKYLKYYHPEQLWKKVETNASQLGKKVLLEVLSLYYMLISEKTPLKIRVTIMAALGYFILPTDVVSDFIPVLGFSDDIAFLSYAFTKAQKYLTPETKTKASELLGKWFPDHEPEALNLELG
ncbi:MAG: DUF1232 domain-containing protein [Bacteroidales bacterium]|nr:DUF1232 domain-containing protein [Bacteroidales bacterium]